MIVVELGDLQARIEATFGARDRARGVDGTFRWWVEEVGEVAKALRSADRAAPLPRPTRVDQVAVLKGIQTLDSASRFDISWTRSTRSSKQLNTRIGASFGPPRATSISSRPRVSGRHATPTRRRANGP